MADVNVLVSGLISPHGACGQLLHAAFEHRWELVVSPHLLVELEEVLARAKFSRIERDELRHFLAEIRQCAVLLADAPQPWPVVTRDPDDDYLVALALAAGVDALISGDAHLTELTELVPPVMGPADFLARVEGETEAG